MAVAFITRDFNGEFPFLNPAGCAYYRCALPLSVCGQPGSLGMPAWDPVRGFGVKETHTSGLFGYKTVVLKLIMDRSTPRQIEIAKSLGQRIIVDIDDYYEGLTPANKAYFTTHPEMNKLTNRDNYQEVIDRADTLTVSTPFLLEHHQKTHPDVRMVRNGVNMDMFTRRNHKGSKPVLGWTGATNYRNTDLEQLREWLPDFLEQHDLTIHHAGHSVDAPSFSELTGVPWRRITTSPLVPMNQYPDGFRFDIGIVPLNDIPFNHAKSSIKGLEYVAAGIPFVASDLPEYRALHEDGVGAIAATPEQWVAALEALLNTNYRNKTASREYSIVRQKHSILARSNDWQSVFTG